jgi:hypothetical protein
VHTQFPIDGRLLSPVFQVESPQAAANPSVKVRACEGLPIFCHPYKTTMSVATGLTTPALIRIQLNPLLVDMVR